MGWAARNKGYSRLTGKAGGESVYKQAPAWCNCDPGAIVTKGPGGVSDGGLFVYEHPSPRAQPHATCVRAGEECGWQLRTHPPFSPFPATSIGTYVCAMVWPRAVHWRGFRDHGGLGSVTTSQRSTGQHSGRKPDERAQHLNAVTLFRRRCPCRASFTRTQIWRVLYGIWREEYAPDIDLLPLITK